jgi:carboxymethylenebutenolidase
MSASHDDEGAPRPSGPPGAGSRAGEAYLVRPDEGPGHGVLVLHSWWGLGPDTKRCVERLADAGYTALAPDLNMGTYTDDAEEARTVLAESDPNATAALVLSSVVALRAHSADPDAPVAVIGFSMGASWGLWLATRQPESVDAVVAYYGVQNIDFDSLTAPVLGHFADEDPMVSEDELTEMHARLLLSEKSIEVHRYPGTGHWFAEEVTPGVHDPDAAELAWHRTLEFLSRHAA